MNIQAVDWDFDDEEDDDDEVVAVVPKPVEYNLSQAEIREARGRLVRVASMGRPLDRFGARVVLSCAQYGVAEVEEAVEQMSQAIRDDAHAVLFLLRKRKIKVGKFLTAATARKLQIGKPSELLSA